MTSTPHSAARPRVAFSMTNADLRDALLPPVVRERLDKVATVVSEDVLTEYESAGAREVLAGTDVLLTGWGAVRVTPALLDAAPSLRLVAHGAGSVRTVFDPACYRRGVMVTTAAQANAWPVAQWTLAMVLLAGKKVHPRSREFAARRNRDRPWQTPVGNFGVTVGIIGASRIGRLVLAELPRHGYRVLLADPTLSADEANALGAELVPLPALMAASDIVSLHAPILESTKGMITRDLLATMKDGATFINSARGILVDHDALRDEARTGRIDCILDVTWPEPLPSDDELWDLPNVWLTPHLAGAQGRELGTLGLAAVSEIECLAAGRPYLHPVTAEAYEATA